MQCIISFNIFEIKQVYFFHIYQWHNEILKDVLWILLQTRCREKSTYLPDHGIFFGFTLYFYFEFLEKFNYLLILLICTIKSDPFNEIYERTHHFSSYIAIQDAFLMDFRIKFQETFNSRNVFRDESLTNGSDTLLVGLFDIGVTTFKDVSQALLLLMLDRIINQCLSIVIFNIWVTALLL